MGVDIMTEFTIDTIPYFTQSDIEALTLEQLSTLTPDQWKMFTQLQIWVWFNQEQYALWKQCTY